MQKPVRKIVSTLVLCLLLTMPMLINTGVRGLEQTILRVDPPEQEITVESFFDVFVYVESFFDVFMDGIILTYDTSIIDAIDVEACPPFSTTNKAISDENGMVAIESVAEPPVNGSVPLAHFTFHCTGQGTSSLTIAYCYLLDPFQIPIHVDKIVNGYVLQTNWVWKPPYVDYAPSGVPDFDQKQWGVQQWMNPFPPVGTWSYCGPVAVANSLWWLDSAYDPLPLVQSYVPGADDHDPRNVPLLVEDLARLMDTNGQRFGHMHCGTEVHEMTMGLSEYIYRQGLDWKFYVHLQKAPDFFWIEEEIEKCQDVVLLLGFWQGYPGQGPWWRVGGHYVTCAGVDSTNMMLAVSDPYIDNAEMAGIGRVLPPPPHPHTGPPETVHNDAAYVSHDFYPIGPSPSPGGPFGFYEYPAEYVIDNFGSCQNTPDEFIQLDGEYVPQLPIYTEIEYAVVTSCKTGIVAAGSEDTNLYVWDFYGTLQWQFALANPVVSVAMDNNGRFIAAGTRSPGVPVTGGLWLFDASLGGPPGNVLWAYVLPVSTSYDGGWGGTESKSVDVKYNNYDGCVVVAAATDQGLYLYDQSGSLIWRYYDGSPETIVRISQDGNYIICADYNTGFVHYFSHLGDGVPGWGPNDVLPVWTRCGGMDQLYGFWVAISGNGDYVAVSVYPSPMAMFPAGVVLFDRTGSTVWFYVLLKGGFVRVDMPCNRRSVVSVNDDPSNTVGCDLNYWSDMTDGTFGWSFGDGNPAWTYWPGKEFGNPQNPMDDFYTVSISENGRYVATGGVPTNTYLLQNSGIIQQKMGLMPSRIQSADLTFEGKYGASVDWSGTIWFFNKDSGFMSSWTNPLQSPFHCVAISKIYPCMFPYPNHDVAVTGIATCKDGCLPIPIISQGYTAHVNVTVMNMGDFTETFEVTAYANTTLIGAGTVVSLAPGTQITLTFIWNTAGFLISNYTISAKASIVPDELETNDNTLIYGSIKVAVTGDVNADHLCNMRDIGLCCSAFDSRPGDLTWNPNADINDDHIVNMRDIGIACDNFNREE